MTLRRPVVFGFGALALILLYTGMPARSQDKPQVGAVTVEQLKKELDVLKSDLDAQKPTLKALGNDFTQQRNALKLLADFNPPVGTIIAYAGEWPPTGDVGMPLDAKTVEARLGWFLCDGRALKSGEFKELFRAVGQRYGKGSADELATDFNLPDCRGLFFRGVDEGGERDKDPRMEPSDWKTPAAQAFGSVQDYATARPRHPFKTDQHPGHSHGLTGRNNKGEFANVGGNGSGSEPLDYKTAVDGRHEHSITEGGDSETRPRNIAMYWVIKVRPATGAG
jgi:microcystin-dependent protein